MSNTIQPLNAAALDKLEALAKAATPRAWCAAGVEVHTEDDSAIAVTYFYGMRRSVPAARRVKNAAFIAAANPQTILALIAQARAAQPAQQQPEYAPEDVVATLREYASNPGYSHNDYADTMRQAAHCIESLRAMFFHYGAAQAHHAAATTGEDARDAARLDFLGGPAVVSMHQYEPSEGAAYIAIDLDLPGSPTVRGLTLREAIDAAMSAPNAIQKEGQ